MFSRDSTVAQAPEAALKGQFAGATPSERYMTVTGLAGAGLPVPAPIDTPELPADEVNKRYAPPGTKITDKPMREGIAQIVGKEKQDAIDRDGIISRYEAQHSWIWNFGVGTAAFMLDPVNASTAFIPGVGEEAVAARLGGGFLARTAGRAVAGATAAVAGQLPLIGVRAALDPEEASDMSARDVMRQLFYAAAGGAVLQAGIGGVAERFRAPEAGVKTPAPPAGVEPHMTLDEALAMGVRRGEAYIQQQSADARWASMRAAISQIMDGRPVDVMPVIDADAIRSMGQEAQLRNERAGLQSQLDAMPEQSRENVAAEKLNRLEAVERGLADENVTPEQRHALSDRRDELLTDTNPEQLRAQAAPVEMHRQLQNQIASIDAQLEAGANRQAAATAGRLIPQDPNAIALRLSQTPSAQRQLYRNGFAQGVPQSEFNATNEAVYGPKAEPEVEPSPPAETAPKLPAAEAKPPSEQPAQPAVKLTPEEQEAADLEAQWQRLSETSPVKLDAQSQAELETAIKEHLDAQTKGEGYNQAASCLDGSGV
jgi:hypothetical protein